MRDEVLKDVTPTLSLAAFWDWLVQHPNCIVRAGTQECVLFDDEDLHWHLTSDGPDGFLVQVVRGKHILGELRLNALQVSYVQGAPGEQEGEFVFELISENEAAQVAVYFFVLSHGYEPERAPARSHVH